MYTEKRVIANLSKIEADMVDQLKEHFGISGSGVLRRALLDMYTKVKKTEKSDISIFKKDLVASYRRNRLTHD